MGFFGSIKPKGPTPAEYWAPVLKRMKSDVSFREALDIISEHQRGRPVDRGNHVTITDMEGVTRYRDTGEPVGQRKFGLSPKEAREKLDLMIQQDVVIVFGIPEFGGHLDHGTVRAKTDADRKSETEYWKAFHDNRAEQAKANELVQITIGGQTFHCSRQEAEQLRQAERQQRIGDVEAILAQLRADELKTADA